MDNRLGSSLTGAPLSFGASLALNETTDINFSDVVRGIFSNNVAPTSPSKLELLPMPMLAAPPGLQNNSNQYNTGAGAGAMRAAPPPAAPMSGMLLGFDTMPGALPALGPSAEVGMLRAELDKLRRQLLDMQSVAVSRGLEAAGVQSQLQAAVQAESAGRTAAEAAAKAAEAAAKAAEAALQAANDKAAEAAASFTAQLAAAAQQLAAAKSDAAAAKEDAKKCAADAAAARAEAKAAKEDAKAARGAATSAKAEITAAKKAQSTLQTEVSELKRQLHAASERASAAAAEASKEAATAAEAVASLEHVSGELSVLRKTVASQESSIASLKAEVARKEKDREAKAAEAERVATALAESQRALTAAREAERKSRDQAAGWFKKFVAMGQQLAAARESAASSKESYERALHAASLLDMMGPPPALSPSPSRSPGASPPPSASSTATATAAASAPPGRALRPLDSWPDEDEWGIPQAPSVLNGVPGAGDGMSKVPTPPSLPSALASDEEGSSDSDGGDGERDGDGDGEGGGNDADDEATPTPRDPRDPSATAARKATSGDAGTVAAAPPGSASAAAAALVSAAAGRKLGPEDVRQLLAQRARAYASAAVAPGAAAAAAEPSTNPASALAVTASALTAPRTAGGGGAGGSTSPSPSSSPSPSPSSTALARRGAAALTGPKHSFNSTAAAAALLSGPPDPTRVHDARYTAYLTAVAATARGGAGGGGAGGGGGGKDLKALKDGSVTDSADAAAASTALVAAPADADDEDIDSDVDEPLRLPYVSLKYLQSEDEACLKRLQSIINSGCGVDVERDVQTLLYLTASLKPQCVIYLYKELNEAGANKESGSQVMRIAALGVRVTIESWADPTAKKAKEEIGLRQRLGILALQRGCPLFDEPTRLRMCAQTVTDKQADPVYRFDPQRSKFGPADFAATVPTILGIKEHAPPPSAGGRRFTSFRVTSCQRVANEVWQSWKAEWDRRVAGGK